MDGGKEVTMEEEVRKSDQIQVEVNIHILHINSGPIRVISVSY